MQVIWQEDKGIGLEGPPILTVSESFAEKLAGGLFAKDFSTLLCDDGEKEGSAWNESASVVGHEILP
jgi:hypothetical protein